METAIGVFSSRDQAEEAVRELRLRGVPEQSIVFLTRSESEAKAVAKEFGASVGGFVGGSAGMAAGVVAASLLLPGIGTVFALGFGAAALLGLAGAGAGAAMGSAVGRDAQALPTTDENISEEAAFFREVLKEGRSLVVVNAESQEVAKLACSILDRLGLSMEAHRMPGRMETNCRQIGDIVVLDISGRITLGEGNVELRELVRDFAEKGNKRIILNLNAVNYVDSSGLGELVKTHTTLRNKGGELKLANLNRRINDLLQITRLSAVFDIHQDEASALSSFRDQVSPKAVA
jgi:anti-sigma B factor antagonist